MPKPGQTYVCEECGGRFKQGWSDAEAEAEARRTFGIASAKAADFAVVCDDCYRAIMRRLRDGRDRA